MDYKSKIPETRFLQTNEAKRPYCAMQQLARSSARKNKRFGETKARSLRDYVAHAVTTPKLPISLEQQRH
jgi:hypothetical protein